MTFGSSDTVMHIAFCQRRSPLCSIYQWSNQELARGLQAKYAHFSGDAVILIYLFQYQEGSGEALSW